MVSAQGVVRVVFASALILGVIQSLAQAQPADQIGVAAAVNPQAQGTPPSAETRTLQVGVQVQANERIVTSAGGQAQMLFLDESAFTVGPNSDVVLDEFVFDPTTGTGKIALTAAKGVFRLVGGKISKRTPVTLKTPTATIGIRGGIALVNVAPNGATQATFLFGDQMTVDTGGGRRTANRPGFSITADDPDAPPSDPAPTTGEQLDAALGSLEGGGGDRDGDGDGDGAGGDGGGQSGGNQQVPSDEDVADAGLDDLGSDNDPDAVGPAGPGPGGDAPGPAGGGAESAQSTTDQSQQNTVLQDSSTLGVTLGNFSGRFRSHNQYLASTLNSTTLAIDPDTTRNIGFKQASASGGTFTASLGSSTLSLPVQTGTFSLTSAGTTPFGSVSGTGVLSSDQRFLFYELTESNSNKAFVFAGVPFDTSKSDTGFLVQAFALRKDFLNGLSTDIPFLRSAPSNISVSTATSSPFYRVRGADSGTSSATLQATLGIVGQGSAQQSVFLGHSGTFITNSQSQPAITGGFRGSQRTSASSFIVRDGSGIGSVPGSDGASLFTDSSGNISHFVLNNDAYPTGQNTLTTSLALQSPFNSSLTTYAFDHVASPTTTPSGVGTTRTSRALNGYVGGLVERNTTSSFPTFIVENDDSVTGSPGDPTAVRITTNASTNRLDGEFGVQVEDDSRNYELRFGTTSASSGRGTFIDDNTFGARDSTQTASTIDGTTVSRMRMFMVNQDMVKVTGFLPSGVSFCACEFLEWGYWTVDAKDVSNNVDRFHLATWVAGVLPTTVEMPTTGTAT